MAVTDQTPVTQHTGNASATAFAYTFLILQGSDLKVSVNGIVLTSGYTVGGVGNASGGTVTLSAAPASGAVVLLYRETVKARATDYQDSGDLLAATVNRDFDRVVMMVQEAVSGVSANAAALRAPNGEALAPLPAAAERALRIQAYDADGQPTLIPGVDPGSAAALALDLTSNNNAAKGAGQVGVSAALLYGSGTAGLYLKRIGISLADWPGVDPTGATECGAAVRLAMAHAVDNGFGLLWNCPVLVGFDPASAFDDGGTTRYTYALRFASNSVHTFAGGSIKQAPGSQSWQRLVTMQNASGVRVFGEMRLDCNVANRGAVTNEHMHGLFLYNTTDSYIERVDSRNARGDNIFIGGDNETTHSRNITIGSIRCVAAGRKNLVIHMVNRLQIGIADLDNATGGATLFGGTADSTDRHCVDVEPDAFTGATRMEQWIGRIKTRGMGNDFTAGTTPAQADAWVLNVGTWDDEIVASTSSVFAWEQNGITLNVQQLSITGIDSTLDSPVKLFYAARLNCDTIKISGKSPAGGRLVEAAAVGADANFPKITANLLSITNTTADGAGLYMRTALANVQQFEAQCGAEAFVYIGNASAVEQGATIGEMATTNTGIPSSGYAVLVSRSNSLVPAVSIGKITCRDSRGTKAAGILSITSGCAAGVTVGEINNPNSLAAAINWGGTDKFVRLAGGGGMPAHYLCTGTPESMIAAPIGSIASRTEGGAGTSFYVKQTGTGTTGWVGK